MSEVLFRAAGPAGLVLAMLALAVPAEAARVADVYAGSAPLADASAGAERAALGEALRRVLIKASGHAAAGEDPALLGRLGDPSALVQQFRRDPDGSLWAQFDPVAVRTALDAGGFPVWGEERPLTVVWIAYDGGNGERDVLASAATEGGMAAALRQEFLDAARARGVPVVLPLRDSQDIAAVTFADLWGDFTTAPAQASARYGADAILIGRVRLFPAGMPDARWTLLVGGERADWRGGIAEGAGGLAERLAQRLAARGSAGAGERVRLAVSGIRDFDQYGQVLAALQALDVVADVVVAGISGNTVEFELSLRADRDQLARALAVTRVIEPAASPADAGGSINYRVPGPH